MYSPVSFHQLTFNCFLANVDVIVKASINSKISGYILDKFISTWKWNALDIMLTLIRKRLTLLMGRWICCLTLKCGRMSLQVFHHPSSFQKWWNENNLRFPAFSTAAEHYPSMRQRKIVAYGPKVFPPNKMKNVVLTCYDQTPWGQPQLDFVFKLISKCLHANRLHC